MKPLKRSYSLPFLKNRFPLVLVSFLIIGLVPLGRGADTDVEILRPRLGDSVQEVRMTSLNWQGMFTKKDRPVESSVESKNPTSKNLAIERGNSIRILLDAGHGGKDLGALGLSAITEKNICLRLTRLIKRELEREQKLRDLPIEIGLTRDKDEFFTPYERAKMANDWNADLFLSIHANYSEHAKARGFEVYFLSADASSAAARNLAKFENGGTVPQTVNSTVRSMISEVQASHHIYQSSQFAEKVFQAMSRRIHPNGRGIHQGPFTVLSGTTMPAILVEIGYLSNPQEVESFLNGYYLKRMASAISTGILEYLFMVRKLS